MDSVAAILVHQHCSKRVAEEHQSILKWNLTALPKSLLENNLLSSPKELSALILSYTVKFTRQAFGSTREELPPQALISD